MVGSLKVWRRIAMLFDRSAHSSFSTIILAAAIIARLREYSPGL